MFQRQRVNFSPSRGFTLLELLLATALLTILMVGVLAVVADVGASKQTLARLHGEQVRMTSPAQGLDDLTIDATVRLLHDDLLQAEIIDSAHDNQLLLSGYNPLHVDAGENSHRPVEITYALEMIDGESCLIRRQVLLDGPENEGTRRDLVCRGLQRFTLTVPPGTLLDQAGPGLPGAAAASRPHASQDSWVLRLWVQGMEAPRAERTIYLRLGGQR